MSQIEMLAVPWDATKAEERLIRRRRRLIGRLISFAITVALVVGLYLWQRSRVPDGPGLLVISIVVVVIALAWVVAYAVAYRRARRQRAEVGTGLALRVGRPGVEVAGLFARWEEVAALAAVRGRWGASPRLRLTTTAGAQASVAWDQIEVWPATLDSTVRAYSGGRRGVDLEALDT